MLDQAFLVFSSIYQSQQVVRCLSLKKTVQTHKYASNSVIVSLAAYITYTFPHLDISRFPNKIPKFISQKCLVNDHLTYHPLQEFWCDKIYNCILKNHVIRKQNILYIALQLQNQEFQKVQKYAGNLISFQLKHIQNSTDQILKYVSGYSQLPRKSIRIAFLNVSGSQLRKDPYMPIINVRSAVLGQIYNNQIWKNYDVLKGEVPTVQQLLQLDGVLIPGSTNSVLSHIQAIQQMSSNLFTAFKISKKLKIFGICYGHQLIAIKNNGDVIKKKRTDKIQQVKFQKHQENELKNKFSFLQKLIDKDTDDTLLLQHHEDYVQTVSDDFYVLAKSASSKVQILLHKTGRMLSFQSHPQYFQEFTTGFTHRIHKYYDSNYQKMKFKKLDEDQLQTHRDSSTRMRKVMSQFFNWNC